MSLRGSILFPLLIALSFVSPLCFGEHNAMPPIEIKVKLLESEIREGGELMVEHAITRLESGKNLIEVDEGGGRYEYEFRSKHLVVVVSEALRRAVSKANYVDESKYVYGDAPLPEPVPPRRVALLPQGVEVFVDDISKWYVNPPPPGKYQLVVHYNGLSSGRVSSQPVAVKIVRRKSGGL